MTEELSGSSTPKRLGETARAPDADLSIWASAVRAIVVIIVCGGVSSLFAHRPQALGGAREAGGSRRPCPLRTGGGSSSRAGDRFLDVLGSLLVQNAILAVLSAVLTMSTWLILRGLLRADLGVLSRVTVGLAVLFASLISLLLVFSTAVAVDLLATCLIEDRPPMIEAAGRLGLASRGTPWTSSRSGAAPGVLDWQDVLPARARGGAACCSMASPKLIAVLVIAVPVAGVARAIRGTWLDCIARTTGS